MHITSAKILSLLEAKHAEDVFLRECKNGPSQGTSHLRMDAWAMRRSWSNPLTVAYEVKVSRQDFVNDDKWRKYLDYCAEFYFVSPPDVIRKEELPNEAGLIHTSTHGKCLYTRKKAPRRAVQIPEKLWRYILMSRVRVCGDNGLSPREFWERWLQGKKSDKEFGMMVGQKIHRHWQENVSKVQKENRELKGQIEGLQEVARFCDELGIQWKNGCCYVSKYIIAEKVRELERIVPRRLINSLKTTSKELNSIAYEFEKRKPICGIPEVCGKNSG